MPGMHHCFLDWIEAHKDDPNQKKHGGIIMLQENDPLISKAQKVCMRTGSLLVWDSRLAHANFPNDSNQFRIVQYLSFFPDPHDEAQRKERLEVFIDRAQYLVERERLKQKKAAVAFEVSAKQTKDEAVEIHMKFPDILTQLGKRVIGLTKWE